MTSFFFLKWNLQLYKSFHILTSLLEGSKWLAVWWMPKFLSANWQFGFFRCECFKLVVQVVFAIRMFLYDITSHYFLPSIHELCTFQNIVFSLLCYCSTEKNTACFCSFSGCGACKHIAINSKEKFHCSAYYNIIITCKNLAFLRRE